MIDVASRGVENEHDAVRVTVLQRVADFLRRPEFQKVCEEARGLAKDASSKARIDQAHEQLLRRGRRKAKAKADADGLGPRPG